MNKKNIPNVTIYTDGACDPNPGQGGWAALILFSDLQKEITGQEGHSTNNRMELMAAIKALQVLQTPSHVKFFTDSQYLKLGVEEWMPNWIKRGWKRKAGKVANIDLWQELNIESQKHLIEWNWVRGHSGDPHNERVNLLAQRSIHTRII